jgi:hypothetical protein
MKLVGFFVKITQMGQKMKLECARPQTHTHTHTHTHIHTHTHTYTHPNLVDILSLTLHFKIGTWANNRPNPTIINAVGTVDNLEVSRLSPSWV